MRFLILLMMFSSSVFAQKYMSKEGYVHFFSEAPMENIEAENKKVAGVVDVASGAFAFKVSIEEFQFDKSLMQEHFNENYMESDQYPFSTFTGTIKGFNKIDLSTRQEVEVNGMMNMHGLTQKVKVLAMVWMQEERLHLESSFVIKLADYNIDIPKIVMYNIAEEIDVKIKMQLPKVE